MSHPPKIDRKILKSPDEFVKSGTRFLGAIAGSRIRPVPILIAVGVALLGLYAYDLWDDSQDSKSWVAYYEATKAPEADRDAKLKQVQADWSKTRAGMLAAVNLADKAFDKAKAEVLKDPKSAPPTAEEAVQWYGKAAEFKELQPMEKQLLLINRGQSFELGKKYDEALGELKTAADMGTELKALALLSTGRVLELKSDTAKALETYEKIAADFATTEYGKLARNHARRLKSPLFQGQTL